MLVKTSNAQVLNDFGFIRWQNVNVFNDKGMLSNPWVGGLNNIQMGKMDLNNDENDDLILFDRHGNRILPYLYQNSSPSSYIYAPEYIKYFPSLQYLFQLQDYNGDGKPDIFTYTTGGLLVYRNTSTSYPSFEKAVAPFIKSLQGNIFTNLLVTNVDYPAIKDIDNDGDLDILTFWGLGAFIEYHKNMSMETYGSADSLLYHKVDFCWGHFSEDIESNQLVLDTCVNFSSRDDERHTGSTLLLTDVNRDDVLDLVLGDVDYSSVPALINGGSNIDARMIQVIDSFPASQPINISSFPLVQEIDIFNDGVKNLVASPFDPSLIKSKGANSVWLYNQSTDGNYELITKSFLQDEMIDKGLGCYPVFTDINNDNLIDLIIANFGQFDTSYYNANMQLQTKYVSSISVYKNIGTSEYPQFTLVESDFANLSSLELTGLYPAFHDIDDDGDVDMVLGNSTNQLLLFNCIGMAGDLPQYDIPQPLQISGSSTYLTPTFVDIEEDGLIDIVTGNREGKLSLYKNIGTQSQAVFSLITNDFGNVNVTDKMQSYTGYSVPIFFKSNNRLRLLVGSETGEMQYFPSITLNANATFIAKNDVFKILREGIRSAPALHDINNDGFVDLAIGNYSGGIVLYKGTEAGPSGVNEREYLQYKSLLLSPNPANDFVIITLPSLGSWQISIYDSHGYKVNQIESLKSEKVTLSTNSLRSGLYVIVASQLEYKRNYYSGKLLITR